MQGIWNKQLRFTFWNRDLSVKNRPTNVCLLMGMGSPANTSYVALICILYTILELLWLCTWRRRLLRKKIVGMGNKMKESCRFAWRMIVEISLVLRTGLALLDYFARHHLWPRTRLTQFRRVLSLFITPFLHWWTQKAKVFRLKGRYLVYLRCAWCYYLCID